MSRGGLYVVHLVRVGEPVASLERFVRSYLDHPAGIDHRVAVLYKGFDGEEAALGRYREAAANFEHEELHVGDEGFDLTAYRAAAEQLAADRYCFLNSHSEVLADRWLELLASALDRPEVGIAGATGSWMSHSSLGRALVHLPNAYSGLIGSPADVARVLGDVEAAATSSEPAEPRGGQVSLGRRAGGALRSLPHTLRVIASFDQFPARHLRTNAFAIEHALLTSLPRFALRSKFDAHKLESGRSSLTRQVQARGLRAVVVDRDGGVWEEARWPSAETFWQGDQRGLTVADNQTRVYADGGDERRLLLSRCAWGALAAPALRNGAHV
jgi:hypothetical protein